MYLDIYKLVVIDYTLHDAVHLFLDMSYDA